MDDSLPSVTAQSSPVPNDPAEEQELLNPLVLILSGHKSSAFDWQQRRHDEWTENYMLYRLKV